MRPASNAPAVSEPVPVERMSLEHLKKLRDDPWKVSIFHRRSEKDAAGIVMESVSAPLIGAVSPYCKRQLEDEINPTAGHGLDQRKKAGTITGGEAGALKQILRFFNKYCDNKNAVPLIGNPELPGYCQTHQAAEILEIELLTGWAMVETRLVLEEQSIHPANFSTVLRKYEVGRYVDMLMEPLAYSIANRNGGYHEECRFVIELGKKFPDFWADVKVMVDNMNEEHEQELNARAQAVASEDDRKRKEAEARRQLAQKKRQEDRKQTKQQSFAQRPRQTVNHHCPAPAQQAYQGQTYARVAAATFPRAQPTTNQGKTPSTNKVASTSFAAPTGPLPMIQPSISSGPSWASVARQDMSRAQVLQQSAAEGKSVFHRKD